jgi:hypothetical protein
MGEKNQGGEAAVGYEQARRLRATMAAAGIDRAQLWLYYFSIGGDVGEYELDAYLHHSLLLPRLQRDLLAHAANELLAEMAPPQAPYASDIHHHQDRAAPEAEPGRDPGHTCAEDAAGKDRDRPGPPED